MNIQFARIAARAISAVSLALTFVMGANAQEYPNRPVKVIVSFGAGAGLDVVARFISERLAQEWNSGVVVENRPGGSGIIAAKVVSGANPDGYTLLFTSQVHYTNAFLYKSLPYEMSSFIPVARVGGTQLVLITPATADFSTVKGLISHAKANPQKVSYASLGNGSSAHMAGSVLAQLAGIQMLHVPYKEGSQALTDTIRGEVSLNFVAITTAQGQLKAGRVKALGVTGSKRAASLPDVPTVAESVPGYEVLPWYVLLAPAGTPPAVIEKISAGVLKVARSAEFEDVLRRQGLEVLLDSASEFSSKLPGELRHWEKVVGATGIKLDFAQ